MRLLSAADIEAAVPMHRAMKSMREAFVAISTGRVNVTERQALPLEAGTGLLMGAASEGLGIAAKLVSVMPGNVSRGLPGTLGALLLADPDTGQPQTLMEGTAFTAWRTAAVSACAADILARADARCALMIGCGTQAATQLVGLVTARRLETVRVHARDRARVHQFVNHYGPRLAAELAPAASLPEAVAEADIIICVTNSDSPVFDIKDLKPGAHVNGIGSFRRNMCEIDPLLASRARVFVESRDTAGSEAGELIAAMESGMTQAHNWTELGEVINGTADGRLNAEEVTFFKSVGHAASDLHYARAVFEAAAALDLGTNWQA